MKLEPKGEFNVLTAPPVIEEKPRAAELINDGVRSDMRQVVDGESPWPLVLLGETGSGKTCAALCLFDAFGGWYGTLADLHQALLDTREGRKTWGEPHGAQIFVSEFWQHWKGINLAIIDEIGLRSPTDAQFETLKKAIDEREGKPLVVVSNLSLEEIAAVYDDRIASRLSGGTVLTLTGDRRQSGTGT